MPKLTDTARLELHKNVSASLDRLADNESAAQVLAAFLDGDALLVLSCDELRVIPADDRASHAPPVRTSMTPTAARPAVPDDDMPGMYL